MIDLERISAAEVAASAAIHRLRPPALVETEVGRLTLRAMPPQADRTDPSGFSLGFRLGEGRGRITASPELAERLLLPDLPDAGLDGLDAEIAGLLREAVLAPLLRAAEAGIGRAVRLTGEEGGTALPHRLDFEIGIGDAIWLLRLDLDLRGLEVITRAYERAPVAPAAMHDLVLPLAVEAGRTHLRAEELERARPGDLLILEEASVASGRLDLVLGGVVAFACRVEGTTLAYTGEARRRVPDDGNSAAERLDDVPLELVFELGRLGVPLGELRGLTAGHVFELGRDLRHPVDVLLGGRKIGEGELVQIGERIGVRLRSLIPR